MSLLLYESEHLLDQAKKQLSDNDLSAAQLSIETALTSRITALGERDTSVAEILDELGVVLYRQGKYDEALQIFQTALSIIEESFYPSHGKLAPILEHMVDVYHKKNQFIEAEPLCKRALDIYDKTLSGEHRSTLETTYKLAEIYKQLNKDADAEVLLIKALKLLDTPLGPAEDFEFLLAKIQDQQGKTNEAQERYKKAITGFRQRRNYQKLSICLNDFSDFLQRQNRHDEANEMHVQSKQYREFSSNWKSSANMFSATLMRA